MKIVCVYGFASWEEIREEQRLEAIQGKTKSKSFLAAKKVSFHEGREECTQSIDINIKLSLTNGGQT